MSNRKLGLAVLVLLMAGCGGGAVKDKWTAKRRATVSVSGKVTYKGEPLADAVISFRSTGMGETVSASGLTDSTGTYKLTTYESGDGAVVGKHVVSITKSIMEGGDPSYFDINSPNYGKTPPPSAVAKTKHLIPEKYSTFDKSGLTVDVAESGLTPATIELKE